LPPGALIPFHPPSRQESFRRWNTQTFNSTEQFGVDFLLRLDFVPDLMTENIYERVEDRRGHRFYHPDRVLFRTVFLSLNGVKSMPP